MAREVRLAAPGFGRLVALGSRPSYVTTKPGVAISAALPAFDSHRVFSSSHSFRRSPKPPRHEKPIKILYGEEAYDHTLGKAYKKLQASQQDQRMDSETKEKDASRIQADMEHLVAKRRMLHNIKKLKILNFDSDVKNLSNGVGVEHETRKVETVLSRVRISMEAKRRSFALTVFARLGDVGIMARLGRVLTTVQHLVLTRVALGWGWMHLRLLRSHERAKDKSD